MTPTEEALCHHSDLRWIAVVTYRSQELGDIEVQHHFEELEELHDIVERGPDWNAIRDIKVTLNPRMNCGYTTIEEARALRDDLVRKYPQYRIAPT